MRNWLRSYALLMRWTLLQRRADLPFMVAVQLVISVGVVLGFSLLIPDLDSTHALYLTTGSMTISLITVAIGTAPQTVAHQKSQGVLDYQRAMPVPRTAVLAADTTIWVAIALPGTVAALAVSALRFSLTLDITATLLPAVLLVAAASIGVGYFIAYAVKPTLVGIVTNIVLIGSLMFAPINYPADRLPNWLAGVHEVLPFASMAQVIRESVIAPPDGISAAPFLLLTGWAVAGILLATWMMARRT